MGQMVFFCYQAIEFIGITTSETAIRQVLPKVIKEIPLYELFLFYGAFTFLAIMAIIPWRFTTTDSPLLSYLLSRLKCGGSFD